jgi:1-acyl-sn-glycerol-3-phosphate acyltransferase
MRRALLGAYTYLEFGLTAVAFVLPMAIVTLLKGNSDPGMRIRGRWMRRFGRTTCRLSSIWRFSVDGTPPPDILSRGYVVISNHESNADPFLLSWMPFDMRWISKEEIFKIPVIGWLMRFSGDISLRRGDAGSVKAMFEACRATLKAGVPVMIFPEGTRSPDGNMLPFKDGAFQLAIETQSPLLLLAVSGTRACQPKGSLWFGDARARARVLGPLETAGLTLADLPKLKEQARERIAAGARQLTADLAKQ